METEASFTSLVTSVLDMTSVRWLMIALFWWFVLLTGIIIELEFKQIHLQFEMLNNDFDRIDRSLAELKTKGKESHGEANQD